MSRLPARLMRKGNYTLGFWRHGWRKNPDDLSPDILDIETGFYGLSLDVADLGRCRFARMRGQGSYALALDPGIDRRENPGPGQLDISLEINGVVYRAVRCRAAESRYVSRLKDVLLWESGRIAQHFELLDVVFADEQGNFPGCRASLHLTAWPDSFSLTADLVPDVSCCDGPVLGVHGGGLGIVEKPRNLAARLRNEAGFTVETWFKIPPFTSPLPPGWILQAVIKNQAVGHFGFLLDGRKVSAVLRGGQHAVDEFRIPQKDWILAADRWHHLAMTHDGREMTFYLDGVLQGQCSGNAWSAAGDVRIRIGQDGHAVTAPVRGFYDQVRVWNRVLSGDELAAHATAPAVLPSEDALVLREDFEPKPHEAGEVTSLKDAKISMQLEVEGHRWSATRKVVGPWEAGKRERLSMVCDVHGPHRLDPGTRVKVTCPDGRDVKASFDELFNGLVARVDGVDRAGNPFPADGREYDEFLVQVEPGRGQEVEVPFLLDFYRPASITGLCPMLCDESGQPTGIPVQLSKNWHEENLGPYLRAFMLFPADGGTRRYRLRVVYGFYGTLPSASHAQLSLVGWGCNGRWDQLAIGSWGETFCLDMDMSPTDQVVTDVRAMLLRNGANGPKWHWCEAGWGGDWLKVYDEEGRRHFFMGLKTAYLAHGPCLSEVCYRGFYGSAGEVEFSSVVRTLRTDDYVRTFHLLRYEVRKQVSVRGGWLMKMGNSHNLSTPRIAWGNRDGLLEEVEGPRHDGPGEAIVEPGTGAGVRRHAVDHLPPLVDRMTVEGTGPWWVAFPGARPLLVDQRSGFGIASRALVIRSYRATFGGETFTAPTLHMKVHAFNGDGTPNIDLMLVPPRGVTAMLPGDIVELDAQWITLPRVAEDYYGPNQALHDHLEQHSCSWRTVFREAAGNNLEVEVSGGRVLHRYPVIVQAEEAEVRVALTGGLGAVPLRFEGLAEAKGHVLYEEVDGRLVPLDQSVHGNDFWQVDRDDASGTFRITFNLLLDGKPSSVWVLRTSGRSLTQ